jgi:hypothetical protein
MNDYLRQVRESTRRQFFGQTGLSIGSLALASMLDADAARGAARNVKHPLAPKEGHHPAKAKRVIYLHMLGAPSQLELFDYKPVLKKYDGQPCPKEYLEGKRFAFIRGVPNMLATPYKFQQRGEAGTWISELLPNMAAVVDEISVIRSMHTDQFNHVPAQLFVHNGQPRLGYPSMGSWVTYGIGSENQNLPGFVVLVSGGRTPSAGTSLWGSGFLPTVYQGVQCRNSGDPVLYLSDPQGMNRALRRKTLDAARDLNEMRHATVGDEETLTRIAQYELAYRMQISVPEVMDISKEPQHVLDLYGAKPGGKSRADEGLLVGDKPEALADDPAFANNCLLARRMIEAGVRFVQLYDWGWDHHGVTQPEDIKSHLPVKCRQTDRPIAALILDLKQRGLLDETLVVWGGEFGRTPMRQNNGNFMGRDHHPYAFTMWMAGGGIKPGLNFGASDDIGYYPTEDKMSVRDLQATIQHLLGLNPFKHSFAYQGLNHRLIGPSNEGRVMHKLLA